MVWEDLLLYIFYYKLFFLEERSHGIFNKELLMTKATFQYGRHFLEGINQYSYIWRIWNTYWKHNPSYLTRSGGFIFLHFKFNVTYISGSKKQITIYIITKIWIWSTMLNPLNHNLETEQFCPFSEYRSSGKDYGEGNRQYICWISLFATIRFVCHIDNLQRTTDWFILCDLYKLFHKHHVLLLSRTTLPWQSNCWTIGECLKVFIGHSEFWRWRMRANIKKYVSSYHVYCQTKTALVQSANLLQPSSSLSGPWNSISMDYVTTFLLNRITQLF